MSPDFPNVLWFILLDFSWPKQVWVWMEAQIFAFGASGAFVDGLVLLLRFSLFFILCRCVCVCAPSFWTATQSEGDSSGSFSETWRWLHPEGGLSQTTVRSESPAICWADAVLASHWNRFSLFFPLLVFWSDTFTGASLRASCFGCAAAVGFVLIFFAVSGRINQLWMTWSDYCQCYNTFQSVSACSNQQREEQLQQVSSVMRYWSHLDVFLQGDDPGGINH